MLHQMMVHVIAAGEHVAIDEHHVAHFQSRHRGWTQRQYRGNAEAPILFVFRTVEFEPHAAGVRAMWSPGTGIVDFRRVAAAYADEVRAHGASIETSREVTSITRRGDEMVVGFTSTWYKSTTTDHRIDRTKPSYEIQVSRVRQGCAEDAIVHSFAELLDRM